jgi:PKD repeat protein
VFNAPDATFTINGDASFSPIPSGGAENVLVENTNGTPVGAFDGNSNSWVIPDQTIEVNTVNEGAIPSVGTIEIDITDGTNPVTPNDVTIVGRKVTVEVPSGGAVMNVDFSADKVTADVGEVITFTDLTDNSPTHWSWRFDSEGQSIVQNPTFSFSTTGFKNITLLAGKVGAGGVEIKNSYIEILAALLLDAFPNAAAAYSLRKLRAAYTGSAIRVRRSTDNTEQDIGFNGSNGLDTTALLAFVGAGNGFVATWYDQSGNGRDVIQTSSANQPQIVSSGSVIAENGKPSVQFNGTSNVLTASTASNWNFLHQAGIYFNFGVAKAGDNVDPNNIYAIWGNTSTVAQNGSYLAYDDRVSSSRNNALFQVIGASNNNPVVLNVVNNYQSANIQFMHTLKADPNNATASERSAIATNGRAFNKNNTASFTASTNAATRPLSIGAIPDASNVLIFFMKGAIQEQIFYASDQSFNQTAIESNINSFYSIY